MERISIIARIYYLVVLADGHLDEKEIEAGRKMMQMENIPQTIFERELAKLENLEHDEVYDTCLEGLKLFSEEEQVKIIAWMTIIANSDGFMDNDEWHLIFTIYHKFLNLANQPIMEMQKEIKESLKSQFDHAA